MRLLTHVKITKKRGYLIDDWEGGLVSVDKTLIFDVGVVAGLEKDTVFIMEGTSAQRSLKHFCFMSGFAR